MTGNILTGHRVGRRRNKKRPGFPSGRRLGRYRTKLVTRVCVMHGTRVILPDRLSSPTLYYYARDLHSASVQVRRRFCDGRSGVSTWIGPKCTLCALKKKRMWRHQHRYGETSHTVMSTIITRRYDVCARANNYHLTRI